jgi:hypothetical protein
VRTKNARAHRVLAFSRSREAKQQKKSARKQSFQESSSFGKGKEKRQHKSFFALVFFKEKKRTETKCFCSFFFQRKKMRIKTKKSSRKKNHPGTKLIFPARLPTSLSTSFEFHSQVRDGLAWFHESIEHQSISGARLRRFVDVSNQIAVPFLKKRTVG